MVGETDWGQLPPGWGAVWMERGCSKLEGNLTDQLQLVVTYLRVMRFGVYGVECDRLEHAVSVT